MGLAIQSMLLLLPLFLPSIAAWTIISPGSTLFASNTSQSWSSPTHAFSLRFVSAQPPTSPPSFILAIAYSGGLPIIWSAGNGTTIDSSGHFRLLSSGNLLLVNGSGVTVWNSETSNLGVSSGSVDDNGNLVLYNGNVSVWSSFENPTDTLVPFQNLTVGKTLLSGLYSFRLLSMGNLTLSWNYSTVYWNQGLNSSVNANMSSPSLGLQPNGVLSIYYPILKSPVIVAYSGDFGEDSNVLRILKLDNDGNLRIYSFPSGAATKQSALVEDQCRVFGYCGEMGICSYNDLGPICGCPSQNFEPIDPSDGRKGCKRKVELKDCPGSVTMLEMKHTQFLTYPPETDTGEFLEGIAACRSNCFEGSCIASTSFSDGTGRCDMKTTHVISGYQSLHLLSTSFLKVCGPVVPNPSPTSQLVGDRKAWKFRAWIVAFVALITFIGLIAFEGCLWWWCCRKDPKFGGLSARYALIEFASGAPIQFSYKELQRVTKGFKDKLGAGGFGAVYRGFVANGTTVAVKRLEGIEQGERQFRMEVATISSTHHLNLVRLMGFCAEGRHRLLVYEFMKNGSLDNCLFMSGQVGKYLNWEQRFKIAIGTARGIAYLHEECRDCIVHCDIKPENILLDENYNAKVSDFGLAKLVNSKEHQYITLTSVRGTRGYLAPEWLANLPITSKSDVYSYGMVLLEIVSGRRNFDVSEETNRKRFSQWAFDKLVLSNIKEIVDKRLVVQEVDMDEVKRSILVSFWCIQEQPSERPTMGKVVQMLEGIIDIEEPPTPTSTKTTSQGCVSETSIFLSCKTGISSTAVSTSTPSSFWLEGTSPSSANNKTATTSLLHSKSLQISSPIL